MLFNSFEFILFLPAVFLLYWFVFRKRQWQNLLVVVASYVFYGWWDWRFLVLIAFTSLCSFFSGLLIERFEGRRGRQKAVSAANILINLGILGVFKYYNFFVENLDALFGMMGCHLDWVTINIVLPVGISFYTFQALSYSIDVYQHKLPATHDPVEFFAFISFFPQLVAGPIERATNLLPQFQNDRHFDYGQAVDGCRQMLWGFFKKLVVADNCAIAVNAFWGQYESLSGVALFYLGVLFSFQIYCDFSGYSDIAIGSARLFGINLMPNFNYPYFSRTIPEFWRRWHMSLMTWFRDYVYFPLGGSRKGRRITIRNIYVVWAISGLWHGANWTFVCWGMYHATLLALYQLFHLRGQRIFTFLLVVIGWIIFRADNMEQAACFIYRMFSTLAEAPHLPSYRPLPPILVLILVEWIQREKRHALQIDTLRPTILKWIICITLSVLIYAVMANRISTFIYFQF